MHKVRIKPVWTLSNPSGQELPTRVLELLTEVQVHGSLSKACQVAGASYRHAWSLIRDAEAQLGHPLLSMSRGKGSTLSPLAQKLVWAGHRIQARLGTLLTSLESELEAEIERVVASRHDVIRLFASHGFAVETLLKTLTAQGQRVEHKYMGSQEAVASWHAGHCELAGFHIPIGAFEADALAHYARWFRPDSRLIHITQRRQGLLVAHDNPLGIHQLRDLTRMGVRFVNRQATSGTRFLFESMLKQADIAPGQIEGFDLNEYTHAAVAAYVASGMADVGLGVEPPARHFGLDFVPLATERYFLVCRASDLEKPGLQAVLEALRSPAFQTAVNALPGYRAIRCGEVQAVGEPF